MHLSIIHIHMEKNFLFHAEMNLIGVCFKFFIYFGSKWIMVQLRNDLRLVTMVVLFGSLARKFFFQIVFLCIYLCIFSVYLCNRNMRVKFACLNYFSLKISLKIQFVDVSQGSLAKFEAFMFLMEKNMRYSIFFLLHFHIHRAIYTPQNIRYPQNVIFCPIKGLILIVNDFYVCSICE